MKLRTKISLPVGVLSMVVLSSAVAGDMRSMDGTISTQDSTEMMPVDDAHIVIRSNNSGTIAFSDETHPMHGATGGCSGTMLMAKGNLTGGGYCTYKDTAGDSSIVKFTATGMNEKGGTSGTWEMVGGTGKYIGATGGGTYNAVPNEERTASVNTITGDLKLK
ncbi:MAG: hypothetical protein KTR32_13605 [Granulosicoccus sp.]|nr:hypothetical protein [Granulosicoccus sp.]